MADDVVAEESDGTGGEWRQAGNVRGGVSAEGFAEDGEDVAFEVDDALALGDGDLAAAGDDALIGIEADEGVAAYLFAVFDGFKEEALGGLPGGAEEGGDRSFEVSDEGTEDGDEGVILRESEEVFAGGLECVLVGHLRASVNGGEGSLVEGGNGAGGELSRGSLEVRVPEGDKSKVEGSAEIFSGSGWRILNCRSQGDMHLGFHGAAVESGADLEPAL